VPITVLSRQRRLGTQVVRFGVVGVTATATHVGIVLALVETGLLTPFWANVVAFSAALFVSYLGNHKWTFELQGGHRRHFPRFITVAILGLAVNQGIFHVVVGVLQGDYRIALAIVVTVVPAITFVLNRFWAFRSHAGSDSRDGD
jgi:putative flippase GtrA